MSALVLGLNVWWAWVSKPRDTKFLFVIEKKRGNLSDSSGLVTGTLFLPLLLVLIETVASISIVDGRHSKTFHVPSEPSIGNIIR